MRGRSKERKERGQLGMGEELRLSLSKYLLNNHHVLCCLCGMGIKVIRTQMLLMSTDVKGIGGVNKQVCNQYLDPMTEADSWSSVTLGNIVLDISPLLAQVSSYGT
jgi:hypothetical protein